MKLSLFVTFAAVASATDSPNYLRRRTQSTFPLIAGYTPGSLVTDHVSSQP